MTEKAAAAEHLAELEARYQTHIAAMRERASRARLALDDGLAELEPSPAIEEPPPYVAPPPHPYAEHAILPDDPLVAKDEPPGFDDIPLWPT